MKWFTVLAVSTVFLSGCIAHSPIHSGVSSNPNERSLPREYYMPNYTENELYNGFAHNTVVPDLRYQYALLQQPEIQDDLNTIIRNHVEGNRTKVGHVGRVALHVEPISQTYYSHKTRSLCREIKLSWQDMTTSKWMNKEKRIMCQIGPEMQWLPLG
jgi:hypothetical protein